MSFSQDLLSHGPAWNTLISAYIAPMPVSGDPDPQNDSSGLLPAAPEINAITAKVGAAANRSSSARPDSLALRDII